MILTDTGPLVAMFDRSDPQHSNAVGALQQFQADDLVTSWPCFTEAMYFLGSAGGYRLQLGLWQMRASSKLALFNLSEDEVDRMMDLMNKYQDLPMDLADASLVAVAEVRGFTQIFTFDSDFRIYRLADGSALEVVPA